MNNTVQIFFPAILSFICGILITPILTHYFYKYKMWRKIPRSSVAPSENFKKIYEDTELRTPRTGGMVVWLSVVFTILFINFFGYFFNIGFLQHFDFLSRAETLLPFGAFIFASLVGLADDFIQIFGHKKLGGDPIILRYLKIGIIIMLGLVLGAWFYFKLGITSVHIPFDGRFELGFLFIPFFIIILLGVWSTSVIDGIDGLSGGVLAPIFMAYALIAYGNGQVNLAAFCATIVAGILAFLWFNIPPARFYMGESGMIGLSVVLCTIAFLTNTVLFLPIIAFPLMITSLSSIIQLGSRKLRNGKKVFKVAPLHHHFQAIGWPSYKITMRYWIISIMTSIIGVALVFLQ